MHKKFLYRIKCKNQNCGKKSPQSFYLKRILFAKQSTSEDTNSEVNSTKPKIYFSNGCGIVILHVLLLIACLLQACDKPSQKPSHAPHPLQRLRMTMNREPQSLDPRKGAEVVSASLHFLLFEGLTRFNADWTLSLSVADAIDISENKKIYRFHLRETYWSDGSRVTAHDFAYAWKKILQPNFPSPNAHLFYPIKNAQAAKRGLCSTEEIGISVIDESNLQVELENPTPYFLKLTAFCTFFPVQQKADLEDPTWALAHDKRFICNGPFQLTAWRNMQSIQLTRNPFYWDKEKIPLDEIEFLLLSDGMTALHLFEVNQLDLIQFSLCPLPADCLSFLREQPEFYTEPTSGSVFVAFNTRTYPFHNNKLRLAFSLALDRRIIIENITQLDEQPALEFVPPVLKNNILHPLLSDDSQKEALSLFQEALGELGLSTAEELPPLTYLYSTSDINKKTAETIQMQLRKVLGVEISLQALEHGCLLSKLQNKHFEMVQTVWIAQYNDPMNFLERFKSSDNIKNYSGWEDPYFSQLLARSSLESGDKRLETLLEAEKFLIEAMPVIPLYHLNASFLKKSYVKNLISPYSSNLCYAWVSEQEKSETSHEKNPTLYPDPNILREQSAISP